MRLTIPCYGSSGPFPLRFGYRGSPQHSGFPLRFRVFPYAFRVFPSAFGRFPLRFPLSGFSPTLSGFSPTLSGFPLRFRGFPLRFRGFPLRFRVFLYAFGFSPTLLGFPLRFPVFPYAFPQPRASVSSSGTAGGDGTWPREALAYGHGSESEPRQGGVPRRGIVARRRRDTLPSGGPHSAPGPHEARTGPRRAHSYRQGRR
jgi:hypothetical protein